MSKHNNQDRPSAQRLREVAASGFGIEEFREGQLEAMKPGGDRDVLAVICPRATASPRSTRSPVRPWTGRPWWCPR